MDYRNLNDRCIKRASGQEQLLTQDGARLSQLTDIPLVQPLTESVADPFTTLLEQSARVHPQIAQTDDDQAA